MKKRLGSLMMGLALLFTITGPGVAGADYNPAGNKTIYITIPSNIVSSFPLNQNTYEQSIAFQTALHALIVAKTGIDTTYSYIILNVNGTPVLAVDPPSGMW